MAGSCRTHTVRNATVGGIRDARTAGIRPANAPIRMAVAMPPGLLRPGERALEGHFPWSAAFRANDTDVILPYHQPDREASTRRTFPTPGHS
jgi:hypothetical protein